MSKDDIAPGLLSKLVKFVRNPATNWTELDSVDGEKDDSVNKQLLKEMIERKRRNDFVRKREFDMLRNLRKLEAVQVIAPNEDCSRPSFFQSSMTSPSDARAVTLKKIDDIEAQMSMQWWKGKNRTAPDGPSRPESPKPKNPSPDSFMPVAYQPTMPAGLDTLASTVAPTQEEEQEPMLNDLLADLPQTPGPLALRSGMDVARSTIGVLGITFKENCPDIRNSKVVDMVREFEAWGAPVVVADPLADPRQVEEEHNICLGTIDAAHPVDVLVVAVGHRDYRDWVAADLRPFCRGQAPILVDVKSLYDRREASAVGFNVFRL